MHLLVDGHIQIVLVLYFPKWWWETWSWRTTVFCTCNKNSPIPLTHVSHRTFPILKVISRLQSIHLVSSSTVNKSQTFMTSPQPSLSAKRSFGLLNWTDLEKIPTQLTDWYNVSHQMLPILVLKPILSSLLQLCNCKQIQQITLLFFFPLCVRDPVFSSLCVVLLFFYIAWSHSVVPNFVIRSLLLQWQSTGLTKWWACTFHISACLYWKAETSEVWHPTHCFLPMIKHIEWPLIAVKKLSETSVKITPTPSHLQWQKVSFKNVLCSLKFRKWFVKNI